MILKWMPTETIKSLHHELAQRPLKFYRRNAYKDICLATDPSTLGYISFLSLWPRIFIPKSM